jgi:hypothetical protein
LVSPILAATSHFLQLSKIRATTTFTESFAIYTATVGYASTGKTTALKYVSEQIVEITKFTVGEHKSVPNQASGWFFRVLANGSN